MTTSGYPREHITLEISVPLDGGGTQMHYIATEGFRTGPSDTPANTYFAELVDKANGGLGEYRRDLFNAPRVAGAARAAKSALQLINAGGVLDAFHRASPGGQVVARIGVPGTAYPAAYERLFVAYVNTAAADFERVRLELGDRMALLDAPVVTATFKGTGGLEGTVTAANKKQLVFGTPGMVPIILLDPVNQIYYVQANATDQNTISGLSEFGHPFEGGVPVDRGNLYSYPNEMLAVEPGLGEYRMWAGNAASTYNRGGYVDVEAALTYCKGPVYLRLKAPPIFDIRFGASGLLQNTAGEAPRAWRFTDMCNRAGLSDVGPGTLATLGGLTQDFDMGSRLVEGDQTYADTMNDRAAALLGAFGFDRVDRFYCATLLDPGDGADVSAYTFTTDNAVDFARTPVSGMENPVWQVSVRSGRAFPSNLAEGASTEMSDILSRQQYLISFTGTSDEVRERYPRAQSVTLEIDGHDFPTEQAQLAFVQAFGRLHGTPRDFISLTCTEFSATTRALDLLSKVTLRINRFGFDAGVLMRVISISHNYTARTIRFGLWGGNGGYYQWALGGGRYPAGSGDPGGSNGGAVPPASFATLSSLRDTLDAFTGAFTGAVSMSGHAAALLDPFTGLFTGTIAAPSGDPDFASVALLMHFNGADASAPATDSSGYGDTETLTSPYVISTAQSKWGGASVLFPDGATGVTPASWSEISRYGRGSGQGYTFEVWFWKSASATSGGGLGIVIDSLGSLVLWLRPTGTANEWELTTADTFVNTFTVTSGAWHFLQTVVATDGTSITKVDGTTVQTTSSLGTWSTAAPFLSNEDVALGSVHFDDWRITPGVARAFAVPTAAFPDS